MFTFNSDKTPVKLIIKSNQDKKQLNENAFQKSRRMARSPIRSRSASIPSLLDATDNLLEVAQKQVQMDISVPTKATTESELIAQLQKQLECAMREIDLLRNQIRNQLTNMTSQSEKKDCIPSTWEEEEEIVARETDWILKEKKTNKKRKALESPEKSNTVVKARTEKKKTVKPPPIVLSNVQNYGELKNRLQMDKFNCSTSMLNNKQVKVNVNDAEEYRELTKMINGTDLEWHTYENKANRPIRVMARDLHPSCEAADILEELKERGYKIISVVQKLKKLGKKGEESNHLRLPLYMLTFEHTEDINKIYNIQYLNRMKVKIEAIKTNKLIAQCKKCQRYGHTQKFCNRPAACVRCAGNHLTAACPKPRNIPAKCANCNEAHPANYRGCTIAKELQKRRDAIIKNKKSENPPEAFNSNMRKDGTSYSQIAKNQPENAAPVQNPEPSMTQMMKNVMEMLDKINQRLDNLEAKSTGAISKRK